MAKLRAERKQAATVNDVSHGCPTLAHTEAEADTEEAKSKDKPASPRGSRLPAEWVLPDDWREWAQQERPQIDVNEQAACFADYWHAKAGKDARKADWHATWRNWIRNSRGAPNAAHQKLSAVERVRANAIAGEAADRARANGRQDVVGPDG
jgi:hypothetical protein